MGKCWGDIDEGVRVEVVNSDTSLSTKVYWIAEIIKLAGKGSCKKNKKKPDMSAVYFKIEGNILRNKTFKDLKQFKTTY